MPPSESRESFWARVAFANYVQLLMPNGRNRLRKAHWDTGRQAFLPLLDLVQPMIVVALGTMTWDKLPVADGVGPELLPNGHGRSCMYERPWGVVLVTEVRHPTIVQDPSFWHPLMDEATCSGLWLPRSPA